MKSPLFYLLLIILGTSCTGTKNTPSSSSSLVSSEGRVEIMLLGSDHLARIYEEGNPTMDMFSPKRQAEIREVNQFLQAFEPDMLLVEELPEEQGAMDSLFTLYRENRLVLEDIPGGRSEIYQFAFQLGKSLDHSRIYCVNAAGGTSQSVLDNGENIDFYKQVGARVRKVASEKYQQLEDGSLSIRDFLIFLNEPETVQLTHYLRYLAPARVTNGTFNMPDAMIDTASINPKYIGAELTSVFKNRDYKIYSNIVNTQMREQSKRIVLIIGQSHIGSLQSILRDDPAYKLVEANSFLKK